MCLVFFFFLPRTRKWPVRERSAQCCPETVPWPSSRGEPVVSGAKVIYVLADFFWLFLKAFLFLSLTFLFTQLLAGMQGGVRREASECWGAGGKEESPSGGWKHREHLHHWLIFWGKLLKCPRRDVNMMPLHVGTHTRKLVLSRSFNTQFFQALACPAHLCQRSL